MLASACGPMIHHRSQVNVPHPLVARPAPTEVAVVNAAACTDWNIDTRACTSRARLVRADAREVCVEVTLGQNRESQWVDTSRFTLASDTGNAAQGRPTGRRDQPATFRGIHWWYVDVPGGTERRERPHMYSWLFSTRGWCFANDSVLTRDTQWMEARVLGTGGDNLAFRWSFGR